MMTTKENSGWLTLSQFCTKFDMSRNLVLRMVHNREIRAIQPGGKKILIAADALDRMADKRS